MTEKQKPDLYKNFIQIRSNKMAPKYFGTEEPGPQIMTGMDRVAPSITVKHTGREADRLNHEQDYIYGIFRKVFRLL